MEVQKLDDIRTRRLDLLRTDIYGITAESWSLGRSNSEIVSAMLRGGIRVIQYREKQKSIKEKYRECLALRELTNRAGALFIINDHVDLALAVDADGVHIGQDDLPPEKVRELIGPQRMMGISTHSPRQAQDAVLAGADYIGAGPLYSTRTKSDVCAPVGLEYLDYIAKNVGIPFVAIGGIKLHNLNEVIGRGAACVAMVTEIVGAEDPEACIRDIRKTIHGGNQ